jgi:hypothetical protein
MTAGIKANVDGSGAIQVNGTDYITIGTTGTVTVPTGPLVVTGSVNAPNTFGFKNRIINGAMVIDQRNNGASVSTSVGNTIYTIDRWQAAYSATSKYTVQQNAGSVTPPAGFTNYLGVTSSSAYSVISTDYFFIRQFIEGFNVADLGWGTANAQTITVSFWVRSSLTGTFGGSLRNSAGNRSYPFSYTISSANTWEQKTITIAGDTSGTWLTNNGVGIELSFSLGMGSTLSATAGAWAAGSFVSATGATSVVGTNGATFYITGVQLEKGSTATSFDYRPYGTELALCQRYYYRNFPGAVARALSAHLSGTTTTTAATVIQFPVEMRTAPTALEQTGTASDYEIASGSTAVTLSAVPAFNNATNIMTRTDLTVASGIAAGQSGWLRARTTAAYLGWSAEL